MNNEQRPKLKMNKQILARIFSEINRTPTLEIGGRFFGKIGKDGSLVVDDFIPTGPEPDNVSEVELLPDRRYQLWTLDKIRTIQSEIDLFGSWHSHIPNGLERFSRQDHRAYHMRLQPPYPHPGMLCGLIHTMPSSVEEVRDNLLIAWFPAGEELGFHSFYQPQEVTWVDITVSQSINQLIHLTEHSQYQAATGRVPMTLNDWHRAINHIATAAVDPQHEIRQSPDGLRLMIIEQKAGDEGFALEVSANGTARCHLDADEPTEWMDVSVASSDFERALHEWYDIPTEWSHLNRTLASLLTQQKEPKKTWLQRVLGL